jgi:TonB family protein
MQRDEVYLPHEIARAAGVPLEQVVIATGGADVYVGHAAAVRIGRRLAGLLAFGLKLPPPLFASYYAAATDGRETRKPLAVARVVQAVLVVLAAVGVTTLSVPTRAATRAEASPEPVRLVFIAEPGPGGGGGGGGDRRIEPVRLATRQGKARIGNPVAPAPPPAPAEPEPTPPPELLPDVEAPIAPVAADPMDRRGSVEEEHGASSGPGAGPGLGTGDGPGLGPGTGGGTGGGVYGPGSGVAPPRLIREVKATYPDAARQRGTEGEVLLSLVVRRDGRPDDVRVTRSLGPEFDDRARDAVRQWRFEPARLQGVPVDVAVEVAVEFRLR